MTNREALLAQIDYPLKSTAVDLALLNQGIEGDAEYTVEQKQAVETALAGLILIVATSPKSVSELDYSLSKDSVDDLLKLRSLILKRYDLPDELACTGATIHDATHFWGTTNYD